MRKSQHFLRIHKRVARRLWSDLSMQEREIIAADDLHTTETFKWFEAKVATDAQRLYEDPAYYDNQEYTFRISDQ